MAHIRTTTYRSERGTRITTTTTHPGRKGRDGNTYATTERITRWADEKPAEFGATAIMIISAAAFLVGVPLVAPFIVTFIVLSLVGLILAPFGVAIPAAVVLISYAALVPVCAALAVAAWRRTRRKPRAE